MREFETLKQRQKQKPKHISEEHFPAAAPRSNGLKRELNQAAKWQWLSYPYRHCLLRFIAGCLEPFFLPLVHRLWHSWRTVFLIAFLVLITLAVSPLPASAWNIPGHMLSASI